MARRVTALLIVLSLTNLAWADDGLTGAASPPTPTAETDSSRDSAAPADETAGQLAELIADIDAAELVEDAVAAYNAANLVDRGNLEVNLAYMKKMLKLGQLEYAVYGARWVLSVDPGNILALSVLAYRDASTGDIESAMPMIFDALRRSPDDASLLHDAGQMVAWFDAQEERADWPEDIKLPIIANRGAWLSQTSFREAYEQTLALMRRPNQDIAVAAAVVEEIAQRVAELEEQISLIEERVISRDIELGSLFRESATVEFEVSALFWSAQELRAKVAAANSRILELQSKASLTPAEQQELIGLRSEVEFYEHAINASYDEQERPALIERAGELRDLIRAAQRESDELVLRARRLMRDRGVVVEEHNRALSELAARMADRSEMIRRIGAELDWRLPVIDGAVIDVRRAQQDYLARIRRPTAGNEMSAAEELHTARDYIEVGEIDMAVKCLQGLLVTHEGSRAAEEARELLERLQPEAETAQEATSFPSGE